MCDRSMFNIDRLTHIVSKWLNLSQAYTTMGIIIDLAIVLLILVTYNLLSIINWIYSLRILVDILQSLECHFYSRLLSVANINVDLKGEKNILTRPRRALVVSNHLSLLDYLVIATLAHAGENTPLFLAWNEMIQLPQLKWLIKRQFLAENWSYTAKPSKFIGAKETYCLFFNLYPHICLIC